MTWDGAVDGSGATLTLDTGVALQYEYDNENHLTAVQNYYYRVEFTYDYLGRRVKQVTKSRTYSTSGVETLITRQDLRFVYDGWHMIATLLLRNSNTL
jgi:YD repeat-containing protein